MKKYALSEKFTEYELLKLSAFFSKEYGTCLLYSGGKYISSKKSYLFLFPFKSFAVDHLKSQKTFKNFKNIEKTNDVFEVLNQNIDDHFWSGFLSYEMGAFSDENIITPFKEGDIPLAYFQKCLITIEYDHRSSKITLYLENLNHAKDEKHLEYVDKILNLKQFLNNITDLVEQPIKNTKCVDKEDKASYLNKILKAKEMIYSGDLYQVNLSHEFKFQTDLDYFDIFYRLVINNPSPFSAYFYFGDIAIVSNSPERLLQKNNAYLEARPIKGTISRGETKKTDQSNLLKLTSSKKEQAELVMITDLLRNDLGRVSEVGSVNAKLNQIEKYENIFHTLSIIKSKANPKLSNIEVLKAIYPGGSITGCPKIEAKKVIHQLEGRARNIYTGSIGFFKKDSFDFNICIRTILFCNNIASVQLGSAIVADSDPLAEYIETILKGKSLFKALNYQMIS